MIKMQFPLGEGFISDGSIHEIEPLRLYTIGMVGNKVFYILYNKVVGFDEFNSSGVGLNSLIVQDGNNFACIYPDVYIDYYFDNYEIYEEDVNNFDFPEFIYLGEEIDVNNYFKCNGSIINKKEFIPIANTQNGGENKFIGNAYSLRRYFPFVEFIKAPTFEEKDELVQIGLESISDKEVMKSRFSLDVPENTFGHIFTYDSNLNVTDIEVLILSGKHDYNIVYGMMNNPIDYKFAGAANKIKLTDEHTDDVDVLFSNIDKVNKGFYLANNKRYRSKYRKK